MANNTSNRGFARMAGAAAPAHKTKSGRGHR